MGNVAYKLIHVFNGLALKLNEFYMVQGIFINR